MWTGYRRSQYCSSGSEKSYTQVSDFASLEHRISDFSSLRHHFFEIGIVIPQSVYFTAVNLGYHLLKRQTYKPNDISL